MNQTVLLAQTLTITLRAAKPSRQRKTHLLKLKSSEKASNLGKTNSQQTQVFPELTKVSCRI
jgi:hypothetical protein